MVIVSGARQQASAPLSALFHKRVLFFVGKGGVGKTAVAAACALAAARQGKKTLLVEIEEKSRAARLLGLSPLENAINIRREVSSMLTVLTTSGAAALEEYLHLIIPVHRLVRMLVESRPYQYFVAAAPGLKELLTIGKIWYEERRREAATQQPHWDLLIIDLPATGHALQYLQMPCAARDTFSEGLVHREAERITSWLRDPEKTAVNLVATPEELPVSETLDAYRQLTEQLQLPLGALFMNRVHEAPCSSEFLSQVQIQSSGSKANRLLAAQMLVDAKIEAAWAEAQNTGIQQLQQLKLPNVQLPFCFAQNFGPEQVNSLSYRIEDAFLAPQQKKTTVVKRQRRGTST